MADEAPRIVHTPAGPDVFYKGRRLYGDASRPACELKAESIPLEERTLYILFSPVLWWGVETLVNRLPSNSALLVFEADPALVAIHDWEGERARYAGDSRIGFGQGRDSFAGLVWNSLKPRLRKVSSISLNAGRLLNSALYGTLLKTAESLLRTFWRNRGTLYFFGDRWIRNILANVRDLGMAVSLSEIAPRSRVLVCGAGPSLESALPRILSIRHEVYIVCVDTALGTLSTAGIKPDLVVALEGQVINLNDFISAGKTFPALALDLSSTPTLCHQIGFDSIYSFASLLHPSALWGLLDEFKLLPPTIPALGSVGVAAVYLCQFLKPKEIIIVGFDFAYADGKSHARGSPSHVWSLMNWKRLSGSSWEAAFLARSLRSYEGIHGKTVRSDPVLASYAESMKEVISLLGSQGIRVFDLRDSGLNLNAEAYSSLPPIGQTGQDPVTQNLPTERKIPEMPDAGGRRLFFERLSAILSSLESKLGEALGFAAGEIPEDLKKTLTEDFAACDFAFWSFPDTEWPSFQPHNLARARIACARLREFLVLRCLQD